MRKTYLVLFVCLWIALVGAIQCRAQSIISGDVTGHVTDPAGAAVPNASLTLTNINTNVTQKTTTGGDGSYLFAFAPPGTYKLSVSASGFAGQERGGIVVTAGQPSGVDFQLQVASTSTTVEVTETVSALQTENADVSSSFNTAQIANMPNPGGDLTYFAQLAPGVVMNTTGGNGNFSANGMPATANLFTINGMNFNDPFFDVNNSGASNLMLGANDIAEMSMINNAYSAQYGQFAGSQVTYITKTGTNSFHGDAVYNWNGRYLNANQFFNNAAGIPTSFNNFNQWATNVNGPIWKNHTFFDVDYEGLRSLVPGNSTLTLIPSPQFQAATLENLAGNGNAAEVPFYKQIFAIYNGASGASGATPVPGGGCQGFTSPLLAANAPCAVQFRVAPPDLNKEYQWSARVDHNFSDRDRGFVRVYRDNGFQPTYASPYGSTFNFQSNQPQMAGQVSETHIFGPNTVNQLTGSTLFYAAVFVPSDESASLSALPTFVGFSGNEFSPVGYGEPPFPPGFFFPQGRRVFQYQVLDDLSHIRGKHTFRVGISWLHDTITSLDFSALGGPIYGSITTDLADFFNGGGADTSLNQGFPASPEEGIRLNTLGGYVADDWKATDRLTISLNLRLEHYANPTCDQNCFSRLTTAFTGTPNPNAGNIPYNQFVLGNQANAYNNTQTAVWEPRVGLAWRPTHSDKTVVRLGAGVFADQLPGGLTEDAAFNPPGLNAFTIGNGKLAPGVAGSLFSATAQANQALLSQFKSGGSFNSISAAVPSFSAPNFTSFPNTFYQPTYYKWNFEIQQAIGGKMVLGINYSGMHGSHLPIGDEGLNAYCPHTSDACPNGFVGLPAVPASAALGVVTQYLSAGTANYNGLQINLQRQVATGITFKLNYTWSHALDDVSNGGVTNLTFGIFGTNQSLGAPENPFNIHANYGNSDYDVRHYLSSQLLITDMFRRAGFHWGPNQVFGGWTLSSNWFFRTGLPFTIVDSNDLFGLVPYNYGTNTNVFASPLTKLPSSCGGSAVNTPCLTTSEFAPSGALTGFGTLGRNTLFGPNFFDIDLSVMKDIRITEHVTFSFGAIAYNLLNHPNFDQPVADIANPNFGLAVNAVGPPTSLLGAFIPSNETSPRFVEIKGMIRF